MTAHGLRATCITKLFEAGHQKDVVSTNNGHRDPRSALSYLNIDGKFGEQLQCDMFGGNTEPTNNSTEEHNYARRNVSNDDIRELQKKTVRLNQKYTDHCHPLGHFEAKFGGQHERCNDSVKKPEGHGPPEQSTICLPPSVNSPSIAASQIASRVNSIGHINMFPELRNVHNLTVNIINQGPSPRHVCDDLDQKHK